MTTSIFMAPFRYSETWFHRNRGTGPEWIVVTPYGSYEPETGARVTDSVVARDYVQMPARPDLPELELLVARPGRVGRVAQGRSQACLASAAAIADMIGRVRKGPLWDRIDTKFFVVDPRSRTKTCVPMTAGLFGRIRGAAYRPRLPRGGVDLIVNGFDIALVAYRDGSEVLHVGSVDVLLARHQLTMSDLEPVDLPSDATFQVSEVKDRSTARVVMKGFHLFLHAAAAAAGLTRMGLPCAVSTHCDPERYDAFDPTFLDAREVRWRPPDSLVFVNDAEDAPTTLH